MNDVFTSFRDDPALRIAIITGAGERFFSPGWDLKAAAAGEKSDEDWGVGGFGGLNYPRNLNKPIIAAVNGIACGGGFEMVLGTDIIVMEEHAKFALPEINVGVLADAGTVKLRRRIPYHVAVEFLIDGPMDGCGRSQALGTCEPCRSQRRRHEKSARDCQRSWRPDRPCCSRRSSSCCVIPRWFRNTKPSNCTMHWMRCSA